MSAALAIGVGQRVAIWLRQQWPTDTAKHAAMALNTEPRTVKSWLAGNPPSNEFFHAMAARWKKSFVAFVYEPHFSWAEQARLEVELETALASLEEIKEQLRSRNGSQKNLAGEVRPMADRAAAEKKPMVESKNRPLGRSATR